MRFALAVIQIQTENMVRNLHFLVLLTIVSMVFPAGAAQKSERLMAGWLEMVVLHPWQIKLKAKLDSGAKTSSIHAENIEYFEHDDKVWVRFNLPKGHGKKAVQRSIEAPLLREVRIKRHKLPPISRPVVTMSFCLNSRIYKAQFTLADRGNFNYPILLGRRFLKDNFLIDPAATFLHRDEDSASFCRHASVNETSNQ